MYRITRSIRIQLTKLSVLNKKKMTFNIYYNRNGLPYYTYEYNPNNFSQNPQQEEREPDPVQETQVFLNEKHHKFQGKKEKEHQPKPKPKPSGLLASLVGRTKDE